jgi:hypothetical protein
MSQALDPDPSQEHDIIRSRNVLLAMVPRSLLGCVNAHQRSSKRLLDVGQGDHFQLRISGRDRSRGSLPAGLDAFSIAELIHMILALVEHAVLHDVGQVLALAVEH